MEAVPGLVFAASFGLSRPLLPEGALGAMAAGAAAGTSVAALSAHLRRPLFPESLAEHLSIPPQRSSVIYSKGMNFS